MFAPVTFDFVSVLSLIALAWGASIALFETFKAALKIIFK